MTSFAAPTCRFCGKDVVRVTSAKTGRKINLDPVPDLNGTFSVGKEPGATRAASVARFVPREHRGKPLWVAHAATCEVLKHKPRPLRPHTLTLGFAGNSEGTPGEIALASTQAMNAELVLERLADELIAQWRRKCRLEGWQPVWRMVPTFIAQHSELSRPMRDKFSTVIGRKVHPAAAASYDKANPPRPAQR